MNSKERCIKLCHEEWGNVRYLAAGIDLISEISLPDQQVVDSPRTDARPAPNNELFVMSHVPVLENDR